jgi:YidC/Oxa1 family membrane protein insertase
MGFFELFSGALTAFYAVVPSLGLAIILLTILVRLILLPLSIKQTRSMREMQRIQPEVKKLQQKHKGDRQKMNEELMALYKEHGVNPFGGCAPLLLQFPVLIGLFYVIRTPLKYMGFAPPNVALPRGLVAAPADFVARNVSGVLESLQNSRLAQDLVEHAVRVNDFLGIHLNCSASGILRPLSASALNQAPDATRELAQSCGSGLGSAAPYLVFVLLMGFTTWYQQKQMQAKQDPNNPQAAQMQMFAKIMPVMLMFFAFSFPTGVVLYWLTTNVWTIGQQRMMFKVAPPVTGGPGKGDTARPDKEATKPQTGKPARGAPTNPSGESTSDAPKARPHPSSKKKKRR